MLTFFRHGALGRTFIWESIRCPPDKHLDSLRTHWKANKSFPSMTKLADVLGLASSEGVFKVLGRLVDQGCLERVDGRIAPTKKFFALPMLGDVRAGLPQDVRPARIETTLYLVSSSTG